MEPKPYLVVNIEDGMLTEVYQFPTFDEAVSKGITFATAQCAVTKSEAEEELRQDLRFVSTDGYIYIAITQTVN